MVDYNDFLLEVFGDSNIKDNEIYSRLLLESRLKIKHPITCEKLSSFYKRINRIEFLNHEEEREITLVGTPECGPSYFVSSNKDPKSGYVSRLWIDNLSSRNSKLCNLFWLPNTDYIVLAQGILNSSNDIIRIDVDLFDRDTLRHNEIDNAEAIAIELSKREFVHVISPELTPSRSICVSTDSLIPYSNMLDLKGLADKVLPKRKNKIAGFIANILKD
jgi:hypothetical protein